VEVAARRWEPAVRPVESPAMAAKQEQGRVDCFASRAEARKQARLAPAPAAASSPRRQKHAYHLVGTPPMAAKQARLVS